MGGSQKQAYPQRRRQQPARFGIIPMASASPSASGHSRGAAQLVAGGNPAEQLTPQSRPPPKPPDDNPTAGSLRRGASAAVDARRALDFSASADAGAQCAEAQPSAAGAAGAAAAPAAVPLRLRLQEGGSEASGDSRGSGGSRSVLSLQAGTAAAARLRRPWLAPRMAAQAEPGAAAESHTDEQEAPVAALSQAALPSRRKRLLSGMSTQPLRAAGTAAAVNGHQQPKRLAMGGPQVSRGRQAAALAAAGAQPVPDATEEPAQQSEMAAACVQPAEAALGAAAAAPDEQVDDIEVALSQCCTEIASPPALSAAAHSRSPSPQPGQQSRGEDGLPMPHSPQQQLSGGQTPLGIDQGELPAPQTLAAGPQLSAFELSLQLSPSGSQQHATLRTASSLEAEAGLQAQPVPQQAEAAASTPPVEPAAEGPALAESSGGAPLDLYMDLSSSGSSQADSPTADAATAAAEGPATVERHDSGQVQRALSLQLSASSSGEVPGAVEAAADGAAAEGSPTALPEVATAAAAIDLQTAPSPTVQQLQPQHQHPAAPPAAQSSPSPLQQQPAAAAPVAASQPHTSQQKPRPSAPREKPAEQAASSPVQSRGHSQEPSPEPIQGDAALQPAAPMEVYGPPPRAAQHSANGACDEIGRDDGACSPARPVPATPAPAAMPAPGTLQTVPAAAEAAAAAAEAAAADEPVSGGRSASPLNPHLPPALPNNSADSSGRRSQHASGGRGGSSRRSDVSTPVLQLAQRPPPRTPQHAGHATAAATPATTVPSGGEGRTSPSGSLVSLLLLLRPGRAAHSVQPRSRR